MELHSMFKQSQIGGMCLPKTQSGTQWSDQQAKSFEGHRQTTPTILRQEQQGDILQSQKESASNYL